MLLALVIFGLPLLVFGQDIFVGLAVKRVVFTSDHNLLKNYNTNFEGDGTTLFSPRGWQVFDDGTSVTNPVSVTKNTYATIEVDHKVGPAGNNYSLTGAANNIGVLFTKTGLVSTGDWRTDTIQSSGLLPNKIRAGTYGMQWTTSGDVQYVYNGMPNGAIYITWATPRLPEINSVTLKRLNWAATIADNATTEEEAADKIWNAIGDPVDPPYEPSEKPLEQYASWKLMDGNVSGECDEQAELMTRAMLMLGIQAEVKLVRASTDTNVLDLQSRPSVLFPNRTEYLIMFFGAAPNAFEGCCSTAGKYYTVWPKDKAVSGLEMLRQLPCTQAWVLTINDVPPTDPGWIYERTVVPNVPKP